MVTARIPQLKDCGCGVSLSLGAKIISIVFFIGSSLSFVASLVFIIKAELNENSTPDTDYTRRKSNAHIEVISALGMILAGVMGTLAVLLYYGVVTHDPSFVLPWAILTTAFTMIFTLIDLVLIMQMSSWVTLFLTIIIVLLYYCALIVYSHFRELRQEKNLPQTLSENDAS